MNPAHVVLLLGVFITIVAIAGYLIAITLILKHVVNRLVTILGAVEAVTRTAEPVGPIIEDISRDLAAGRKLMDDGVARLSEDGRVPVGAGAEAPAVGGGEPGGRPATGTPPADEADIAEKPRRRVRRSR